MKQSHAKSVVEHAFRICERIDLKDGDMSGLQKVLVVDSGERSPEGALSVELAGMGYASVTAPLEATDDVLALMPSPAAVVLQMPRKANAAERTRFVELARRLKSTLQAGSIPVILMGDINGGAANLVLQSKLGTRVVSGPDV
jgi:hypothetical protein